MSRRPMASLRHTPAADAWSLALEVVAFFGVLAFVFALLLWGPV